VMLACASEEIARLAKDLELTVVGI